MEQFIDFLIREGCAGQFFHNFEPKKEYESFSEYCKESPSDPAYWIKGAFNWGMTPEGKFYWESLDLKWENTLEETTAFDRWWNESGIVDEYNDGLRDIALAAWNAANERSTK